MNLLKRERVWSNVGGNWTSALQSRVDKFNDSYPAAHGFEFRLSLFSFLLTMSTAGRLKVEI